MITIHVKQVFLEAIMIVVQENWINNIKMEEDEEYIDPPSIKKDKIDS